MPVTAASCAQRARAQAMHLAPRGLWAWLAPMQASGAPLPREQLAQRCAGDPALLRFVADAAQAAGGHAAPARAPLLPFFAVLACEVLAALPQARPPRPARHRALYEPALVPAVLAAMPVYLVAFVEVGA
jgi:hypothetical protein